MLEHLGFLIRWIGLVMSSVNSMSFLALLNGSHRLACDWDVVSATEILFLHFYSYFALRAFLIFCIKLRKLVTFEEYRFTLLVWGSLIYSLWIKRSYSCMMNLTRSRPFIDSAAVWRCFWLVGKSPKILYSFQSVCDARHLLSTSSCIIADRYLGFPWLLDRRKVV